MGEACPLPAEPSSLAANVRSMHLRHTLSIYNMVAIETNRLARKVSVNQTAHI